MKLRTFTVVVHDGVGVAQALCALASEMDETHCGEPLRECTVVAYDEQGNALATIEEADDVPRALAVELREALAAASDMAEYLEPEKYDDDDGEHEAAYRDSYARWAALLERTKHLADDAADEGECVKCGLPMADHDMREAMPCQGAARA